MKPKELPAAPEGYASWLDFAVETFDTRSLALELLFVGLDSDRDAMREAARAELRRLREIAASRPD